MDASCHAGSSHATSGKRLPTVQTSCSSISTNGQPYPPTLMQVMQADEAFADFVKNDMQLDDELALRVIHDDIVRSQAAFQAKIAEINQKLQRAAELRRSLEGD